jgi:hypothetical protein
MPRIQDRKIFEEENDFLRRIPKSFIGLHFSTVQDSLPIRGKLELGTIFVVMATGALFFGGKGGVLLGLFDVGLRRSVAAFAADRDPLGALPAGQKSTGQPVTGRVALLAEGIDVGSLGNQRFPGLRMI